MPTHKLSMVFVVYQRRRYDVNYFCVVTVSNVSIYEDIKEYGILSVRSFEVKSTWKYVRNCTALFHYNTTSIIFMVTYFTRIMTKKLVFKRKIDTLTHNVYFRHRFIIVTLLISGFLLVSLIICRSLTIRYKQLTYLSDLD